MKKQTSRFLRTASFFASLAVTVFTIPAYAEDVASTIPGAFTANVSIVSDYVFRGITQSDETPALQGGFDYSASLADNVGAYLGVWSSTIDFNDGDEANIEMDWYGGLTYTYDKWTFDGGVIYYSYPSADSDLDYDFAEVQGKIGYDFGVAAVTGSVNYSSDYFAGSGTATYYKLAVAAPLPSDFTFNAYVGHQKIEDNAAFAVPDYTDWGAGFGYSLKGLDLGLNYIDTSLDRSDCSDGCGGRVVFSVGKKF